MERSILEDELFFLFSSREDALIYKDMANPVNMLVKRGLLFGGNVPGSGEITKIENFKDPARSFRHNNDAVRKINRLRDIVGDKEHHAAAL